MSDNDRAWSWVEHLRAGGTTRWRVWAGVLGPEGETLEPDYAWRSGGDGALPGAQRLEVLRRLNLAGPVPGLLADTVLHTTSLGRGQQERRLVAGGPEMPYGAPRVAPSHIPAAELRRVATGALADLARGAQPAPVERSRRRDRLRPTRVRLVGDPVLVTAYAEQLAALGRPPVRSHEGALVRRLPRPLASGPAARLAVPLVRRVGRPAERLLSGPDPDVAVLLAPLDLVLTDLWTRRVLAGGRVRWLPWLERLVGQRRLPDDADAAVVAARWAGRIGPARVHLVGSATGLAALTGRPLTAPRRLSHAAVEAARATSTLLHLTLPEDRAAATLRGVVVPWLADTDHPDRPTAGWLPPGPRDWLTVRATRVSAGLRAAGYPVLGDGEPEVVTLGETPGRLTDEAVLEALLAALRRAASDVAGAGDQGREGGPG